MFQFLKFTKFSNLNLTWATLLPYFLPMIVVFVHYASTHYYAYACTPWGVWGFFESIWKTENVQCRAAKWLFNYSHKYLHNLWITLGYVFVNWIAKWFKVENN